MKIFKSLFFLCCVFSLLSCEQFKAFVGKQTAPQLETEEDRVSYMLGYILAENTQKAESMLKGSAFLQGVKDSVNQKASALSKEDIAVIHQQIQKKANLKKHKEQGEKNKMEGQKFLEENKSKEGVKVTESGLQYEVLKEGKGEKPTAENSVEVHYRGTLIDGTEFDSSYKRNSSITFPLNQVIGGWIEGLQLMNEGAKYKFYIPSELAYGANGAGQIPPHATLIFEVELLKVQ